MIKLNKLKKGDKVAVLSPSFGAPAMWPHIHELGLTRLREIFELVPVEFPATKKASATKDERAQDLISAFENPDIKGVIATLGGNDQITYIKNLPKEPFVKNPKPFFGYSDNTHFENFLWLNGIPSYYGGCLFTQFAEPGKINEFTLKYLKHAMFDEGEIDLEASLEYNDVNLNWDDPANLDKNPMYEPNAGWFWETAPGINNFVEGITWGGCLESIDELLRHGVKIPSLEDFENVVFLIESSEEIPKQEYVFRVLRALGEGGILEKVQAILVGRPKAWNFNTQWDADRKQVFRERQRETMTTTIRSYNRIAPIVQNLDFGHTNPQIAIPYGFLVRLEPQNKKIFAKF